MKLVSICNHCCNKCLSTSASRSIGFLGPENDGSAVKRKVLCYLEAEISVKIFLTAAIFVKYKMAAIQVSGQM